MSKLAFYLLLAIEPVLRGVYVIVSRLHGKITDALGSLAIKIKPDACYECAGTKKRWCDRTTCQSCHGHGTF